MGRLCILIMVVAVYRVTAPEPMIQLHHPAARVPLLTSRHNEGPAAFSYPIPYGFSVMHDDFEGADYHSHSGSHAGSDTQTRAPPAAST